MQLNSTSTELDKCTERSTHCGTRIQQEPGFSRVDLSTEQINIPTTLHLCDSAVGQVKKKQCRETEFNQDNEM